MKTRFEYRSRALYDVSLSPFARLLAMILDDLGGKQGQAWPKQAKLAALLAASDREVRRCVEELEAAGHLTTVRQRYGVLYLLPWADRTGESSLDMPDRTGWSGQTGPGGPILSPVSISDPRQEPREPASRPEFTLRSSLRDELRYMQAQFPGTEFAAAAITDSVVDRIIQEAHIRDAADLLEFLRVCATRFKGGRAPGRSGGPTGLGLLVRWAQDMDEKRRSA